ncbi:MAG TPA: hypothetical protein VG675_13705 [Bryobacteraceae bacterium]|nr:hypothetical protein [Bryobacteraceae bacterium]
MLRRLVLGIAIAGLFGSAAFAAETLLAGVRRVDITPPPGVVATWGYGAWNSHAFAKGALDPLYAHVLYLRGSNGQAFVWVDLDCGRTPGIPTLDRMRQQVADAVPHVFFSATHTHSGPFWQDDFSGAEIPSWEQEIERRIISAIREASAAARPVKVGFSFGSAVIGYNRRLVRADGSVTMLGGIDGNRGAVANGPTDPTFAVLRFDDAATGEPLAIVLNATAHPVIRTERDMFSADYPGVVRARVSAAFPSRPVCFFLQGAAGDINPQRPRGTDAAADDGVRQLGELLGSQVIAVAQSIRTNTPQSGTLQVISDELPVAPRWPDADFNRDFSTFRGYVDHIKTYPRMPLVTILIDGEIAWAAFPGEFFVELQTSFRARSPLAKTLFVGYSNGYFGYFPTIEAAATGGYGGNNIMAGVELGAGEAMVNRALIDLDRMLGRLRDRPVKSGEPYSPTWQRSEMQAGK